MKIYKIIFVSIIALLSFIACDDNKHEEILFIKHGSSFNECRGYCYSETTFSKTHIIKFSKSWNHEKPEKFNSVAINKAKWNKIISKIEVDDFFQLQKVFGCPDCSDGGAEWIEIKTTTKTHKVLFDFDAQIEGISQIRTILNKYGK